MPVTVRFDPSVVSQQAQVIPDATPASDGVMSKAQAAKLASIFGSGDSIIFWNPAIPWALIAPQIPAPSTGKGVDVIVNSPSGGNPCTITAGAWNLDNVHFYGTNNPSELRFASGATLSGNYLWASDLTVRLFNTIYTGNLPIVTLIRSSMFMNNGSVNSGFVINPLGGFVFTLDSSTLSGLFGAAVFLISMGTNAFGVPTLLNDSTLASRAISGDATCTLFATYDSQTEVVAPDSFGTPAAVQGGVVFFATQWLGPQTNFLVGHGAIVIDPANQPNSIYDITADGNITSLTVNFGVNGAAQRVTLILHQNAAGTAAWPPTITNALLPGGVLGKTLTGNAIDKVELVCDGFASTPIYGSVALDLK